MLLLQYNRITTVEYHYINMPEPGSDRIDNIAAFSDAYKHFLRRGKKMAFYTFLLFPEKELCAARKPATLTCSA